MALGGGCGYGAATRSTATNSTHQRASAIRPPFSNLALFRRKDLSRHARGRWTLQHVGGTNDRRAFHVRREASLKSVAVAPGFAQPQSNGIRLGIFRQRPRSEEHTSELQ